MSLHQRDTQPAAGSVTGYVQTMYFGLRFNYISSTIREVDIDTGSTPNWESENCKLIPHVWYEYTRVSKKNPENSRSGKITIREVQEKLKLFASLIKTNGAVMRIVKDTIVKELPKAVKMEIYGLEESYCSLASDEIAAKRTTREMPPELKEKMKNIAKKNDSTSSRRPPKKRS